LERSILELQVPCDPDGSWSANARTFLAGRLLPDRVVLEETWVLVAQVHESPSSAFPTATPTAGWVSFGVIADVLGAEVQTDSPLVDAVQSVERDHAACATGSDGERAAALLRLASSLSTLHALFEDPETEADEGLSDRIVNLMTSSAQGLAGDPYVLPGTEIGSLVLSILRSGAERGL